MPTEYAHEPGFEAAVRLHGDHWDGDHTFPLSVSIQGLWLRSADLMRLRNHLVRWTELTLEQLNAETLAADFRLARLPGQNVHVRFASPPDSACRLNPEVSIEYGAGNLRGEFHFITDQSCLTLFARELAVGMTRAYENAV